MAMHPCIAKAVAFCDTLPRIKCAKAGPVGGFFVA